MPGLLEGAHEGHGLGHRFLRHVQRCRALVHVLDGTSPDPVGDYRAINLELELFNPELRDKPQARRGDYSSLGGLFRGQGGQGGGSTWSWSCSTRS